MESLTQHVNPWPHRLAVVLALTTFPLIWVGGLVTTYDAGMAVPDWPGTYGYNLLLYPWQSWVASPWDLFIEHGHRLLGAAAGLIAIALVMVTWFTDRRSWLRMATLGALALVVLQGALGGARVLLDERLAAMIHGCLGPLFFAYLAGLVVVTSCWWRAAPPIDSPPGARFSRAAWATVALAYSQLILGAILRHIPLEASSGLFRAALLMHLLLAAALALHLVAAPWRVLQLPTSAQGLKLFGWLLPGLVLTQIALGLGTYVAKYSFPAWLGDFQLAAAYVVQEKSLFQSLVTTAHVANGSLILFAAVTLAMRSSRLFRGVSLSPAVIGMALLLAGGSPAPRGAAA